MAGRDDPAGTRPAATLSGSGDSLKYAKPFGDHGEILRFRVPGFEFRVQRLEADAFVPPLLFPGLDFLAGVSLDRVARSLIESAKALDQHDLALARPDRMKAEEVEASIRNARLHRAAYYVRREQALIDAHAFGRAHP